MSNIAKRPNGKYRARYRDADGKEHARHFARKKDAQDWLDEVTASIVTGTYVAPSRAKMTVSQWCDEWLVGYSVKKASTVKQARTHIVRIKAGLGEHRVQALKPSDVKAWVTSLAEIELAPSTVSRLHARLRQILEDAVADGLIPRNPASRRTSPPAGAQRAFIATTEQVWAMYDAMPEPMAPAVLLGAFAGLRVGEVCALRVSDVDFLRGVINPLIQWPAAELKTKASRSPIPVARELVEMLAAHLKEHPSTTSILTDELGDPIGPWYVQAAVRAARTSANLPAEFRFHDLRHYFASLLIASGCDVKVVQARLRHGSAKTTLDVYGHLWPDTEESTRAATATVLAARADSERTGDPAGERLSRSAGHTVSVS